MATDDRHKLAEAFNREIDPLAKYSDGFEQVDLDEDPFEQYISNVLVAKKELKDKTIDDYKDTYARWRDHMAQYDRHFVCMNEDHVRAFIESELHDRGNTAGTVKRKVDMLIGAYNYWAAEAEYPHDDSYNPIEAAKNKTNFPDRDEKDYPRLDLDEIRERVQSVTHLRDRAIMALQFKFGMRAGEICNIKLSDIGLEQPSLAEYYPELGSNPAFEKYDDALYIPGAANRDGNKSSRDRLMPFDSELRKVILRYLLVRPTRDVPWLFLTKRGYDQLRKQDVNMVWHEAFRPDYDETPKHRAISSHFGRHYMTTHFKVHENVNEELVGYMRGDRRGSHVDDNGSISHYIHTYFEDIESLYRKRVFKLRI